MGIVTDPYSFSNGTTADALQVNARVAAILAQLNGNVDNTNIAAGANIDGAKLLAASINGSKLVDGTVTRAKVVSPGGFLGLGTGPGLWMQRGLYTTPGWAGATFLDVTIPHGMGVVPDYVWMLTTCVLTAAFPGSPGEPVTAALVSKDITNIHARLKTGDRATNSTCDIYWYALNAGG